MLEPTKKAQAEIALAEQQRIANLNKVSVSVIGQVRKYTNESVRKVAKSKNPEPYYKAIEDYLLEQYGAMYSTYKEEITAALNDSGIEQKYLVEQALGTQIAWKPIPLYSTLPTSKPFKYTNAVLSENSILRTNKVLSKRITKIIADGFDKGQSIQNIQRRLDIEFGFRDAEGRITQKARELIKSGKFAHTNGHIYKTYRIARTEVMRMADIQANEVYQALPMEDKRLKMIARLDSRTRPQSAQMNGQLSRADGKFKYPDGNWYFKGEAPARWSINDRETTVTVFLRDKRFKDVDYKDLQEFKADRLDGIIK
jgi:hypothetical protein